MNLFLNGEPSKIDKPTTVMAFLEHLGLPCKGIAVELNREIVPKSAYETTALVDGDQLEIVQFVGGG